MKRLFILFFAILLVTVAVAAQRSTPGTAVASFYRFDRAHSQVFDRRNIDARRAWLSIELYRLFQNELRREAAYLKTNPTDKPYFGGGLPFQPTDEACNAGGKNLRRGIVVKQEFVRGTRGAVTATFAYPKACTDGGEPVVYTIGVIRSKGIWLIDDINYGEDTTLKQRLRRAAY